MTKHESETPDELIFEPQVPFSWTLRSARARRLRATQKNAPIGQPAHGRMASAARLVGTLLR